MEWETFSKHKNVNDVQVHKDYLSAGIQTNVERFTVSRYTIVRSDSIKKLYNLITRESPFKIHEFNRIIFEKITQDLKHNKNITVRDIEFNPFSRFQMTLFSTIMDNVKEVDHQTENVFEGVLIRSYFEEEEGEEGEEVNLLYANSIWSKIDIFAQTEDKAIAETYNRFFEYVAGMYTAIIRTIELRVQNILDAVAYSRVSRAVRGYTFDDIMGSKDPQVLPLLQMYVENEKYLYYIRFYTQRNYFIDLSIVLLLAVLKISLFDHRLGFFISYPGFDYSPTQDDIENLVDRFVQPRLTEEQQEELTPLQQYKLLDFKWKLAADRR